MVSYELSDEYRGLTSWKMRLALHELRSMERAQDLVPWRAPIHRGAFEVRHGCGHCRVDGDYKECVDGYGSIPKSVIRVGIMILQCAWFCLLGDG